jgi:hypothetical protein
MTCGYLILAQNNKHTDYLKMAYVNALSIKLTQKTVNSVSLVTDNIESIPDNYKNVFDNIIKIPWYDDAFLSEWKIENRWKLYYVTPYKETVVLDADMIFLTEVSHWWKYLTHYNMCIVDKVKTYRQTLVKDDSYYRQVIVKNNLPNVYSAFFYFKKNEYSKNFWDLVSDIVKHYKEYYNKFLINEKTDKLSMDIVFSIAIHILGIKDEIISNNNFPTFVHMKSKIQDWKTESDDWKNHVGAYFNIDGNLKLGNSIQNEIVHYTDKRLITDEIMYLYETLYNNKVKNNE